MIARASMNVIPGLVPAAYRAGSFNTAPTPELVSATTTAAGVEFEWQAKGSSVYSITASGSLRAEGDGFVGLKVECSCPDGQRQKLASLQRGTIIVCKHGFAALNSVQDPEAVATAVASAKRQKVEAAEREKQAKQQQEEQRRLQEAEMPGERARIEYGLKSLSAQDVVKQLSTAAQRLDGLRHLSALFPPSKMPTPSVQHCVRCDTDYDPQFASQRVCRVEHPHDACRTMWEGSKKSWQECSRCGKTFGCDGMHSWDRRAVEDQGEWCFEGEHTTDEAVVEDEGWDDEDHA